MFGGLSTQSLTFKDGIDELQYQLSTLRKHNEEEMLPRNILLANNYIYIKNAEFLEDKKNL